MSIQYFMQYLIVIQSPAVFALAQSLSNNSGLLAMAPRAAAAALGIPFPYPTGNTSALPAYIEFFSPFDPGQQIGFPGPSGVFVDDTVLTLPTVSNQGGVPLSIWPVDHTKDGIFTWSGVIMNNAGAGAATNPPIPIISNMPRRLGIGGKEILGASTATMEGGNQGQPSSVARGASRTPSGVGFMVRGSGGGVTWTRTPNAFRALTNAARIWDRFYFRVNALPDANPLNMWYCHADASFGIGGAIRLELDGSIKQYSANSSSTFTLQGTIIPSGSLVLGQWYLLDIIVRISTVTPGDLGIVSTWLNHNPAVSGGMANSGGTTFQFTELGKSNNVTDHEGEIDFDDWITSDWPANFSTGPGPTFSLVDNGQYSLDWLTGSHVRVHKSVSVSQTNWAPASPAAKLINAEGNAENRLGTVVVTSTTSGALLEGLTDAPTLNALAGLESSIGVASAQVGLLSSMSVGSATGRLGLNVAGGGPTTVAITEGVTDTVNTAAYQPVLGTTPAEVSPLSCDHLKSTDANTNTVSIMETIAEYIGVWGPEDQAGFVSPFVTNYHNTRYFGSIYSGLGSRPYAPCYSVGGTYTGNGTYQEITLPTATHFIFIRPTITAIAGEIVFLAASLGPHFGVVDAIVPNARLFFDGTNYKLAVWGGAGSNTNVNTEVYQYIAFCDPGMRFNLCGTFAHGATSSTPKANALVDSTYTADCGFGQTDAVSASGALGLWFRGPGNTGANAATALNATAVETNFGNFTPGFFNSFSKLHPGNEPCNYSLWRIKDSGTDATSVMIQVCSYTGNGGGSQVVNLTPVSNRFPVWVAVFPNTNANSFYRDPSHTSTNSSTFQSSANSITGITAVAKDQITVGTSLNANGVLYSVFAICGDSAGMNNGTFQANFNPGANANYAPPQFNNGVTVLGDGGLILGGVAGLGLLKNVSGIYQLVTGLRTDNLQDTQTGQPSSNVAIPTPYFKTGYIGG